MNIHDQVEFINQQLQANKDLSLTKLVKKQLKLNKNMLDKKIESAGYIYNNEQRKYIRQQLDNNQTTQEIAITKVVEEVSITERQQLDNKPKKVENTHVVELDNNQTTSVELIEFKNKLSELQELLDIKDQLKALVPKDNSKTTIIDIEIPELKINSGLFEGDVKSRYIKVYENVNNIWLEFAKENSHYKMQDLYSQALMEFVKRYKK